LSLLLHEVDAEVSSVPRIYRVVLNMLRPRTVGVDQLNLTEHKSCASMSNGNADGDVLANKMSLMEAKGQRFLSSLLGPQPAAASSDSAKVQDEDADLKVDYGHDR
jgi:hypothetical protein